jgi:peptide/nickel transport system substrate-binding protein
MSRLSRRRFIRVVPIALASAGLLAACGAPATPAAKPTTPPAPAQPTPAPTTAPAAMAAPTPTAAAAAPADLATDQTLRLIGWALPSRLSPQHEGGPLRMMTQNTFRPPFYLDKDGKLHPGVATSVDVSPDGKKYTLKLDPRAKFSDGSKVTAADLKFSWEYMAFPETKTWTADYTVFPIDGARDVQAGKTKEMVGLVVRDAETLEINLTKPYTPFHKILATYMMGVTKKDQVQKDPDNWDSKPICCGPYKVESWNKDSGEITWVPNEHWWGIKPLIKKVTYRYVKDANTQSIMWDNNEFDIFLPTDILAAQMRRGKDKDQVYLIPYGGVYYYVLRAQHKPMEDVNVRRALLKATDMGKIVQAVFQGGQDPAYGIISPNLEGYTNPKPYFDPEGARKALAASTYKDVKNLPPITIAVGTNLTEYIRVSEAIQQMWKEVLGLEITVKPYEKSTDPVYESAQILRLSLGTLVNDPSASASGMGHSTSYGMRMGGHKNEQLDQILEKADSLPLAQQAQRIELYQQAEKTIMDQAYFIPIIWVKYYFAVKPRVKNYAANTDLSLYTLAHGPTPMYIGK